MVDAVGGSTAFDCCSARGDSLHSREPYVYHRLVSGPAPRRVENLTGFCGGASPRGRQAAWNSAPLGRASGKFRSRIAEQGGGLVAHDGHYREPQTDPNRLRVRAYGVCCWRNSRGSGVVRRVSLIVRECWRDAEAILSLPEIAPLS